MSSNRRRSVDLAAADTLVPMLAANILGLAASSARLAGFGRRPHQVAYAVCVASAVRRVFDDRARHADAVAHLVLLGTLTGTRGGSRPHRGIAMAATLAAMATTGRRRRAPGAAQASANCS